MSDIPLVTGGAFKLGMAVYLSMCAHTKVVIIYPIFALFLLSPKTCWYSYFRHIAISVSVTFMYT
jgi:hypothetical protein